MASLGLTLLGYRVPFHLFHASEKMCKRTSVGSQCPLGRERGFSTHPKLALEP
jgi:hypothetical protein